jgi:hypothetical protein
MLMMACMDRGQAAIPHGIGLLLKKPHLKVCYAVSFIFQTSAGLLAEALQPSASGIMSPDSDSESGRQQDNAAAMVPMHVAVVLERLPVSVWDTMAASRC